MFQKLFNPDHPLMITLSQIGDCVFLSMFWLLGSIPLVTVGAASAALYDAGFRAFRQGEKQSWQRFFQVYRRELKGGILPSLVFWGVLAAGTFGLNTLWNSTTAGGLFWVTVPAGVLAGALVAGMLSVLFPMLSRFENSFPDLLKNTMLLSLAKLPRTLALGAMNILCFFLCLRFVFPVFFVPALGALVGSFLIEPMFRPYMDSPDESAAC